MQSDFTHFCCRPNTRSRRFKRRFRSELAALMAAALTGGDAVHPYACPHGCGGWHLSKMLARSPRSVHSADRPQPCGTPTGVVGVPRVAPARTTLDARTGSRGTGDVPERGTTHTPQGVVPNGGTT